MELLDERSREHQVARRFLRRESESPRPKSDIPRRRCPSDEVSDSATTLFTRRGHIKRIAREGTGVWGPELNGDDTVAYLQEIRTEKDFRNQGTGS